MLSFQRSFPIGLFSFALLCCTSSLAGNPREGYVIAADRKESELKAFKRFEYLRNRDEQRERRKYERLSERQRQATMFLNGQNLPWTQTAFRAATSQGETSPGTADVYQASIPPLGADQFIASKTFRDILRSDGSLAPAPPVLVDGSDDSPLDAARLQMEDVWRQTLQRVGSDALVSHSHVAAMQQALARWRRLAAENLAQSDLLARQRGEKYLKSIAGLIQAVENPARREQLRSYYYGSGTAFEGGTVADLVHHVVSNNLSMRPGSRAHLILAELGHDLLRDLDAQIQVADQRVEYYKGQITQSSLDPAAHTAKWPQERDAINPERLPQRSNIPSPGRVNTSVERLRQLRRDEEVDRSADNAPITKNVAWQP
jgi:hypothetical protein